LAAIYRAINAGWKPALQGLGSATRVPLRRDFGGFALIGGGFFPVGDFVVVLLQALDAEFAGLDGGYG
jgi:hypothetical protein